MTKRTLHRWILKFSILTIYSAYVLSFRGDSFAPVRAEAMRAPVTHPHMVQPFKQGILQFVRAILLRSIPKLPPLPFPGPPHIS